MPFMTRARPVTFRAVERPVDYTAYTAHTVRPSSDRLPPPDQWLPPPDQWRGDDAHSGAPLARAPAAMATARSIQIQNAARCAADLYAHGAATRFAWYGSIGDSRSAWCALDCAWRVARGLPHGKMGHPALLDGRMALALRGAPRPMAASQDEEFHALAAVALDVVRAYDRERGVAVAGDDGGGDAAVGNTIDPTTNTEVGPYAPPASAPPPAQKGDAAPPAPGTPAGGAARPAYAKPLLLLAGGKYPYEVAGGTAFGGLVGWLLGGPLWALAGALGGNLAMRGIAHEVCATGKGDEGGCGYGALWGDPD